MGRAIFCALRWTKDLMGAADKVSIIPVIKIPVISFADRISENRGFFFVYLLLQSISANDSNCFM